MLSNNTRGVAIGPYVYEYFRKIRRAREFPETNSCMGAWGDVVVKALRY